MSQKPKLRFVYIYATGPGGFAENTHFYEGTLMEGLKWAEQFCDGRLYQEVITGDK